MIAFQKKSFPAARTEGVVRRPKHARSFYRCSVLFVRSNDFVRGGGVEKRGVRGSGIRRSAVVGGVGGNLGLGNGDDVI